MARRSSAVTCIAQEHFEWLSALIDRLGYAFVICPGLLLQLGI